MVYTGTTIGRQCLIGDLAFVREQVHIGDRVIVGTHVTVENEVTIGSGGKMQTGAYITAWTTIEENCFIAPCVVTTNDNYMGRTERRFKERGGATIRRGARVGANVTLSPNIEVGAEAFVAAGSVVTRPVSPATLVLGSPARARRAGGRVCRKAELIVMGIVNCQLPIPNVPTLASGQSTINN